MTEGEQVAAFRRMLENTILELKKSRAEVARLQKARNEPIAVVGMSCRFPGAANGPEAYWERLRDGVDAVSTVPAERWSIDENATQDAFARALRWGAFLDDVRRFDAAFFGISSREARYMDPQQRMLLELCWEALEDAAMPLEEAQRAHAGVFIGDMNCEYLMMSAGGAPTSLYTAMGNGHCFLAGRVSYALGIDGPCFTVDTACSSSLVALHLACSSLRNRECEVALTGGVNVIVSPWSQELIATTNALSPDGRCRTLDASANGYVRGEGGGVLVLKRHEQAVADGDEILATILGSAVNQDGKSTGLTAPNVRSQEALIRRALQNADVSADDVSYIEMHGTGTPLGDPIEVDALSAVYGETSVDGDRPCVLGAVKTNIGHLEGAAGVAGVIKAILALRHGEIPGNLHFRSLNPRIRLDGTRFVVPERPTPWPQSERRRIAGVSSFGLSGTNAHVILAQPPVRADDETRPLARPWHVLAISAKSPESLLRSAARYADAIEKLPEERLPDACHVATRGRTALDHRLAMPVATRAEAIEKLRAVASGQRATHVHVRQAPGRAPSIGFLFTGQGSQYPGMGRELYESSPPFRRAMDRCFAISSEHLDRPLEEVMFSSDDDSDVIHETAYTQPALFALEWSLAELWRSWGVVPGVVIGHSIGEITAAVVAGALSVEDGLRLACGRGALMQSLPPGGAMLAIPLSERAVVEAQRALDVQLAIASVNGPEQVVVSGSAEGVDALAAHLATRGVSPKRLAVSHAFHSSGLDPILQRLESLASELTLQKPKIPLVSTLTGADGGAALCEPSYWRRQARETVRFHDAFEAARGRDVELFVEIGPHPVLSGMAAAASPEGTVELLPSLQRRKDAWQTLTSSVARLFARGVKVDWRGFDAPYRRRRASMPSYAWEGERYWIGEDATVPAREASSTSATSAAPAKAASAALREELLAATGQDRERVALRMVREAVSEVLSVDDVAADASLWSLGLDSLGAVELRRMLSEMFMRPVSAAELMAQEHLLDVARLMTNEAEKQTALSTALKRGTFGTLHLVHPVVPTVFPFVPLSELLDDDVGLRVFHGGDSDEGNGPTSVEQIAAAYEKELRALQPHGPYALGGYSFGGSVALEMARILRGRGEEVELLVLVDALAPSWHREHFSHAQTDDSFEVSLESFAPEASGSGLSEDEKARLWRATQRNFEALSRYSPSRYGGHVLFVRAAERDSLYSPEQRTSIPEPVWKYPTPETPETFWRGVAHVEVEAVPGWHFSMLDSPSTLIHKIMQRWRSERARVAPASVGALSVDGD